MTVTVTGYLKGKGRRHGVLVMLLLASAVMPVLAQEISAEASVEATFSARTTLDCTPLPVMCVAPSWLLNHMPLQTLTPRRITDGPFALPPQKLSAVIEPPPLPALDALPVTPVDPHLDIVHVRPPTPLPDSLPKPIPAIASFYHASLAGRPTASGERYNPQALTAAHRTLPFGTRLRITNMRNGRSVVVRINDRGPFVEGRGIDLSRAAAELLGMVRRGVARVTIQELNASIEVD